MTYGHYSNKTSVYYSNKTCVYYSNKTRVYYSKGSQVFTAIKHVITVITFSFTLSFCIFCRRPVDFPGTPPHPSSYSNKQAFITAIRHAFITAIRHAFITAIRHAFITAIRHAVITIIRPKLPKDKRETEPRFPCRRRLPCCFPGHQLHGSVQITHWRSRNIPNHCVRVSSSHMAALGNKKDSGLTLWTQTPQASHTHPAKHLPSPSHPLSNSPWLSTRTMRQCLRKSAGFVYIATNAWQGRTPKRTTIENLNLYTGDPTNPKKYFLHTGPGRFRTPTYNFRKLHSVEYRLCKQQ